MKCHHSKKGSVLFYLIVTMAALAVLGTGTFYMTTTSSFSGLGVTARNNARLLAESGMRHALYLFRNGKAQDTSSSEYKLGNAAGAKFILEIDGIGDGGYITIKSTGVSNPGTPYQASHKIETKISSTQYLQLTSAPPMIGGKVDEASGGGISSFTKSTGTSGVGKSGATGVSIDTSGQVINFGLGSTNTYGCVWYQGSAKSNDSDCIDGKCKFNKGIRAYFDFTYTTPWGADGFTFAIISSINNITDCGGGSCGEYMGYAGPGTTGNGLQPPKIAVEFDPYISPTSKDLCDTLSYQPQCSSRKDETFASPYKHASFIYWGTNSAECPALPSKTYDDNRHGDGNGTNDPTNPKGTDTEGNGYHTYDFDSLGTLIVSPNVMRMSFRLEIDRVVDSTSEQYKLRAWLKPYDVYTDENKVTLDDTSKKFNQKNDIPPYFQQTITRSSTSTGYGQLDRMLFGWTQGTGGSTQTVAIKNFKIDFKNENDF